MSEYNTFSEEYTLRNLAFGKEECRTLVNAAQKYRYIYVE